MVLTSSTTGFTNRISNFFFWIWGMIYLFFATIMSSKEGQDAINKKNGNMKGFGKKAGGGIGRMGGG